MWKLAISQLRSRRDGRHLLALFDFDGTLAPFNADPDAVYLAYDVARRLEALASNPRTTIGVISGRRLPDLKKRVQISAYVYRGLP